MIRPLVLASHNWKVLLKSILYQVLLLALIVALGYLIFGGMVDDVTDFLRKNHVKDFLSDTGSAIAAGQFDDQEFADRLGTLLGDMHSSIATIKQIFGGVAWLYLAFAIIVIVYRLLVALTDVAVGCQLEEFMTSNAERPLVWFVIKKQGVAWQFALMQTALALPLDLLLICGGVGLYLVFLPLGWWMIFPVAAVGMLFYVARLTMFAYTLPSVVCSERSTRRAFRHGLARAPLRFWRVYWKTLLVVLLMTAISTTSLLFIDNAILKTAVSTVPNFVLFFYLKCINMTEFFLLEDRPFFYKRMDIEGTDRYVRHRERLARKHREE